MNHQPFRDWLLSEEKLSADQTLALQEHLKSCEFCRQTEISWLEVESTFQKKPQAQPAPGFTNRWQAHLSEYLERKRKRRSWIIIGLNAVIVIVLLGLLTSQIWSLIQAPGPFIVSWFTRLFTMFTIYYTLEDLLLPFSWSVPFLAYVGLFFLVGIISFISVLWLATYRKLSFARRIL
jgi:hypothetical protein